MIKNAKVNFIKKDLVVVLRETETINVAAQAMRHNNIGSVLLVDNDGNCNGIVTDRDLMYGLVSKEFTPDTSLADLVTRELVFVGPDEMLSDALDKMIAYGVRRLPVLSPSGGKRKAIGIVTVDDLVVKNLVDTPEIGRILLAQEIGVIPRSRLVQRQGEARRVQKFNRFINEFSSASHLNTEHAKAVIIDLLSHLCRRITPREAVHFMAQFPLQLQHQLSALPSGPNTAIDGRVIVQSVSEILGCDELRSKQVIAGFWQFLGEHISQGELDDVMGQLPKDIEVLLENVATPPQSTQNH